MLQTSINLMKENGFILKKTKSRRYPAETLTEADYADDLALLDQETLGIGFYVNANKTEYVLNKKEPSPL